LPGCRRQGRKGGWSRGVVTDTLVFFGVRFTIQTPSPLAWGSRSTPRLTAGRGGPAVLAGRRRRCRRLTVGAHHQVAGVRAAVVQPAPPGGLSWSEAAWSAAGRSGGAAASPEGAVVAVWSKSRPHRQLVVVGGGSPRCCEAGAPWAHDGDSGVRPIARSRRPR